MVPVRYPDYFNKLVPHGNRLDPVELNLSLQNLLDLSFVWSLLHLLSPNQVQELGGEDQISLHSLGNRDRRCVWADTRKELKYLIYT